MMPVGALQVSISMLTQVSELIRFSQCEAHTGNQPCRRFHITLRGLVEPRVNRYAEPDCRWTQVNEGGLHLRTSPQGHRQRYKQVVKHGSDGSKPLSRFTVKYFKYSIQNLKADCYTQAPSIAGRSIFAAVGRVCQPSTVQSLMHRAWRREPGPADDWTCYFCEQWGKNIHGMTSTDVLNPLPSLRKFCVTELTMKHDAANAWLTYASTAPVFRRVSSS